MRNEYLVDGPLESRRWNYRMISFKMKQFPEEILLIKNTAANCFEALTAECRAMIKFHQYPGGIIFFHLMIDHVPGRDQVSGKLIEYVLEYARERNLKIIPLCPHIRSYIQWHVTEFKCVGKIFIASEDN